MGGIEIAGGILILIAALLLIVIILMQNSDSDGLGAIGGGSSDSYYGKNKGRTIDAILGRWTKIVAVAFFVLTIGVNIAIFLVK